MSRVLLVSTDDWLRSALEVCLSDHLGEGHEVVARSGATAVEVADGAFDAVLVDAGHDPAAVTSWCAQVTEQTGSPVLVLHDDADVDVLTGCLEAGAAGFQTKAIGVAELVTALDAVRRGEAVVPRRMLGGLLGSLIQRKRRDDEATARYERLTRREREILAMIAHGGDRNDIAARLVISPQTARTHIQNVLTKLDVHSRIDAARFAHDHGYHRGRRPAMTTLTLTSRPCRADGLQVVQDGADSAVLVATRERPAYRLNDTALALWELCDGEHERRRDGRRGLGRSSQPTRRTSSATSSTPCTSCRSDGLIVDAA